MHGFAKSNQNRLVPASGSRLIYRKRASFETRNLAMWLAYPYENHKAETLTIFIEKISLRFRRSANLFRGFRDACCNSVGMTAKHWFSLSGLTFTSMETQDSKLGVKAKEGDAGVTLPQDSEKGE